MKWKALAFAACATVSVAGCSLFASEVDSLDVFSSYTMRAVDATENPDEKRVLGILHFFGDTAPIEAPQSAVAGEPFEVTITTFGGGCDDPGSAVVKTDALLATIEPYDFTVADEKTACPDILKMMSRSVQVTFQQPGEAVLRVVGLRVDASNRDGVQEVIDRTITVK